MSLLFGVIALLIGCDVNIVSPDELPRQFLMTAYDSTTQSKYSKTISEDDPVYRRLKTLITEEQSGWSIGFSSPPHSGPYLFESDTMHIICYQSYIIIRSWGVGKKYTVEKDISDVYTRLGLPMVDIEEYVKWSRRPRTINKATP